MTRQQSIKCIVAGLIFWGGLGLGNTLAQLPPPPPPTTPPTTPPTGVPLDGGVILLAAAGAAYGAKKMYGRNKKAK